MTQSQMFDEMVKRKIVSAVVAFSGGNDEGGADRITLTFEDGHTEDGDLYEEADPLTYRLSHLPNDEYGSFAGEFHVSGRFHVDRATRKVTLKGHESHPTWTEREI